MSGKAKSDQVQLGEVSGVLTWRMPVFPDLRGRLFKAYVAGSTGSFPLPFETYEHFFTESRKGVFRGMHFQGAPHSVAKIISLVRGQAVGFLLDTRPDSHTFGNVQMESLNESTPLTIYIPHGVALGYLILEDETTISYRMDGAFCANCDGGISADVIAPYLPVGLEETIRSDRDLTLDKFETFKYSSACAPE